MDKLIANLTGKTRKETLNGREYLVAPMTMMVPGVLNGSQGPLYYPKEEITKNVEIWNGVPITLRHPEDNGTPVSARTPQVIDNQGLGFVFNAKDKKGNLAAEAWIDVEKTEQLDSRILDFVANGNQIELSTGLFSDKDPTEGNFNGKDYDAIVRNFRPDHLALLPDEKGACSIEDGCGLMVNKKCKCGGSGDCLCNVKFELTNNELSHETLHHQLRQALRSKFTQDEPGAWVVEVYDTFFIYEQGSDLYKLSYTKSDTDVSLSSETPQKVIRETNFVTANEENKSMAKKDLIEKLVANCSCWTKEDTETLEGFTVDKLKNLVRNAEEGKANELVANAAREGFEDESGNAHKFDDKEGKWSSAIKKTEPVVNKDSKDEEKEFWKTAPPSLRQVVQNALNLEKEARQDIFKDITANVEDKDFLARIAGHADDLDLEVLKDIQKLVANSRPAEPTQQVPQQKSVASYFASTGAPTTNQSAEDEGDILPLPQAL